MARHTTRSRARLTSTRLVIAVATGLATGVTGLAMGVVPATATPMVPTADSPQLEVLLSETGSLASKEFLNLDWRDGALHVLKKDNGGRVVSIAGDGTQTSTPSFTLGSYRNGFAAGPSGTFLFPRSYQSTSKSEIVTASADGTVTAPAAAQRIPSWHVADLAVAGDNVFFGTSRYPDDGGTIASLPVPLPADQSAPTALASITRFSVPQDLYLADGRLHQLESGADPLRIFDAATGAQVEVLGNGPDHTCHGTPGQWDGANAVSASFCGPTAVAVDSRGDIFVAASLGRELYKITSHDGVMHWIAGTDLDVSAVDGRTPQTGDDPRGIQVRINDLAIDDSGNLYVSSAWNHYGNADEHTEVLKFPDIAPVPTPLAPTALTATAADGSARVSFTPPTDTGQGPLTGFVVTAHPQGASDSSGDVVIRGTASPIEVTDLTNGTTYDVTVAASNAHGDGPATGPVSVTPRAPRAVLTADVTSGAAPLTVQLDAGGSAAPDGATYEFSCGDSHDPVGPASGATTATCAYDRQSSADGWSAHVVMHDPATGRDYQDTVPIVVDTRPGTVDGSTGFDVASPAADLLVADDGSLTSDSCGTGVTGVTCTTVDGVAIRLAAGPGTFRPGTRVRIHTGDAAAIQGEHGDDVVVQGGFAVTWEPRYDLSQPLVLTIPEQAGTSPRSGSTHSAFDLGGFLGGLAHSLASGAGSISQTIGSGLSSVGTAIAGLWGSAAQSVERPNDSDVNDVITCAEVEREGGTTYCHGPYTRQRAVPTSVLASLDTGGTFIQTRAGDLVLTGGGNVVSAGGGNVVSAGGGNVVVNTAAVVSAGGGNVVSAGGGNVISAGGGNVVSAGGLNLIAAGGGAASLTLFRDPGFSVVEPTDASPPTVAATLDPPLPASGVYPAGSEVTVRLTATSPATPAIDLRNVNFSATGAGTTPYTLVPGDRAVLEIAQTGTTTLTYAAQDAQLNLAAPQTLEVTIAAPTTPTTTTLAAEPDATAHEPVTWTATVVPTPDAGTVSFTPAGGAQPIEGCGSVTLESGVATCTTTYPSAGDRGVVAAFSGTEAFEASTSEPATTTVAKAEQTIDFTAPAGLTYGDPAVVLTAVASSGLPVTYASSTPGVCVVDDGRLRPVGAGSCEVTASQSGDDGYAAAPEVTRTVDVARRAQTITFADPADLAWGSEDTSLDATASSGLPVHHEATPASVCTIVDDRLHVVSAGDCSVSATQPGDDRHAPAAPVTREVTIDRAPLTVLAEDTTMVAGDDPPPVAASYSGLVNGDTATDLDTPPTCSADVAARATRCSGAADPNYRISYEDGALTVTPADQEITISVPGTVSYADESVPIGATSSSGLPVSLSATPARVCEVREDVLLVHHAGTCTLTATQAGDAEHTVGHATRVVTIDRVDLTVTATDAVRLRDGRRPKVAPLLTGFVRQDHVFSLTQAPRCSAKGEQTRCRRATSEDYRIHYRPGRLETRKRGHAFRSAPVAHALVGEAFRATLQVEGPDPVTFAIRGARRLPDGLRLAHDRTWRKVRIVGTPEEAGTAKLRVRALLGGRVVARQRLLLTAYSSD